MYNTSVVPLRLPPHRMGNKIMHFLQTQRMPACFRDLVIPNEMAAKAHLRELGVEMCRLQRKLPVMAQRVKFSSYGAVCAARS